MLFFHPSRQLKKISILSYEKNANQLQTEIVYFSADETFRKVNHSVFENILRYKPRADNQLICFGLRSTQMLHLCAIPAVNILHKTISKPLETQDLAEID